MLTKLEAVNRCLEALGEEKVNSLSSGYGDAEAAEGVLDEVVKKVLHVGWHCNTEREVELQPNNSDEIQIPSDYLRVDTSHKDATTDVTVRIDPNDDIKKLYRIKDRSFTFTDPVKVDIVRRLDFEGIPYHIQNYITERAARTFQRRDMASVALDKFVSHEEQEAYIAMMDVELENADHNVLTDSLYMREITHRNHKLVWR